MKTVHKGEASELVKEIPKSPSYLDTSAKQHFKKFARILISSESLKRIHLPALELMAENFSQWEWAVREL
jgi:phage terminase small subunit